VSCSVERFYPLAPKGKVDIPPARLINRQFQLERDRARVHHERPKAELIDFWQPYLDHVHKLSRTSEFWRLLDHVYRLLGIADKGSILLDAGCGNGDMGMLLLMNQAYRRRASGSQTGMIGRYVGVDLLPGAARQTQANLVGLANELSSRLPEAATRPVLRTSVQIADLDRPLPFRDGQFDRIVCNLTLGFLRDPAGALRELMRVLAPGGRIVLTVLQRHADLSPLLTNLMQRATTAEEAEEARWLWTHWGRAREDEANGLFRFFERHELTDLVKACGAPKPRIYTGLANQAFVLVAEKAVS
jgi:SAM-dependent methyltransferase